MKKWYQKSIAVVMAAACLFAGGTIGVARDSLPQLQLTAEAEDKLYTGESDGLQLKYDELQDGTIEITKFVDSTSTDIELPAVIDGKSVTSIRDSAFDSYSSLTNIIFPDSLTNIGKEAFGNCYNLTSINIPKNVTSIGKNAFFNCGSVTEITVDSDNSSYTSKDNVLFDKNMETLLICSAKKAGTYNVPNGVTNIGDLAFFDCRSLTSITIPDSVTSIGNSAFQYCSSLKNIEMPKYMDNIGNYAFCMCSNLTSIVIPNGVTGIEERTFYECSNLTNVDIPDSVTNIGELAFYNCINLTNIFIPKSMKTIDKSAWDYDIFYGLSSNLENITVDPDNSFYTSEDGVLFDKNMKTLLYCPRGKSGIYTVPTGVTNIDAYAFCRCNQLESIIISESIVDIGYSAFNNCTNLTSIIISDSVTSIGNWAFSNCTSLTSITIPKSVTSIGECIFLYCNNLTDIMVASNNPSYTSKDGVLFDKSMETLLECPAGKSGVYTIPMGVTNIGDDAFRYCENLENIIIPDSVTSIGDWAFEYCENLENIIIPDSVTSIGEYTFSNCDNLTDIYYNGTETEWNQISMEDSSIPSSVTIHYNSESTTTTTSTDTTTPSESTTTTTVKPNLTNIRGDVNGNQLVEVSDAVEVLKYYAKKAAGLESVFSETTAENEAIFNLADVDKDGEITVQDAVLILTYYAKAASGREPTWEELINM